MTTHVYEEEETPQALTVVDEQPSEIISAADLVEMCATAILNEQLPEQRAERSVEIITQLVGNIEKNMIALGYVLYYLSEQGLGYWKYLGGGYKNFNAWCSLGMHLNSNLVSDAIRIYLNWTDLRKFQIDAEIFTREPPSPVKSQILRSEIHEFDRKSKQVKAAHKGTSEELNAKIEQLVEQYKVVLEDILIQPEETLIEEDQEKKGKIKAIKTYFSDITWDEAQMQWDAHLHLEVSSSSELTLAGIIRAFHNALKGKFQNIAELKNGNSMGLLDVADYMENKPIAEGEDYLDEDEEGLYYDELDEEEDEPEDL